MIARGLGAYGSRLGHIRDSTARGPLTTDRAQHQIHADQEDADRDTDDEGVDQFEAGLAQADIGVDDRRGQCRRGGDAVRAHPPALTAP